VIVKPLRPLLFALACLVAAGVTATAVDDIKLDISNWKDILPEPAYTKLVEEATTKLTGYTSSASQFTANVRRIQSEATNLMVYGEIMHRAGNPSGAALRDAATQLLEAAKARKADEAKKYAAALAGAKTGGTSGETDLAKTTQLKIIMEVTVKDLDRNLTQYKRITPGTFASKQDQITRDMYKLAALSVATSAHAPTADLPKGKTTKDWLAAAEDMRKHSLAAAAACKAKKVNDVKKAVNDVAAACAKCHEDFRVETN
jgi:hypothetical protein